MTWVGNEPMSKQEEVGMHTSKGLAPSRYQYVWKDEMSGGTE